MDILLQGDWELDDWIKIIFFVLVFGGSALGGVAKWIIAKLNPENVADEEESAAERPKRQAMPDRPVARPMRPAAAPGRPVATPMPAQPTGQQPTIRERTVQEPARRTVRRRTPPVPRQPIPTPERPSPPRVPTPVTPPGVIRADRPVTTSAAPPARKAKRRKPRTVSPPPQHDLETEGHRAFERLDHEVWDVDTPDTKADTVTAEVCGEFDPIRRPTRQALRQAIIMKEILGPPLSLRPRDESF